tara:strand:- start:58095 stop:58271 length:177 start_codon:yes stop_codon:yes gene_type:complete
MVFMKRYFFVFKIASFLDLNLFRIKKSPRKGFLNQKEKEEFLLQREAIKASQYNRLPL